jgi:hypothetical protein
LRQRFLHRDTELFKITRTLDHIPRSTVKLTKGTLIGGLGRIELATQFFHSLDEAGQFFIQLSSAVGELGTVNILILMTPQLAHDVQTSQQGRGCCDEHVLLQSLLKQSFISAQSFHKSGLDRNEHEHHLG